MDPGERPLALTTLATEGAGLALGTRNGVVKRVNPEVLAKDEWEVIRLDDGDEVVGAVELNTGTETLCFISTDAQLLHFGADAVRPQGRSGGGIAGIRVTAGEQVAWFGAVEPDSAVVVTASGSSTALPGTEPGAVKVTPFSEYPAKGRATGGVRCHRFLKGEDTLVFAWAGAAPARAAAASGAPDRPARGRRPPGRIRRSRAQPIAAAAGPVGAASAARRCARLTAWQRALRAGTAWSRSPSAGHLGPACGVQRRREARARPDAATPRGGPGDRQDHPRRDQRRRRSHSSTTRGPQRSHRHQVGHRASASTPRPSRAPSTSASTGSPPSAEVIAVDGVTYAKNSLLLPDWTEIDPADYGAPDPAQAHEPRHRLLRSDRRHHRSCRRASASAAAKATEEILTEYTGTRARRARWSR